LEQEEQVLVLQVQEELPGSNSIFSTITSAGGGGGGNLIGPDTTSWSKFWRIRIWRKRRYISTGQPGGSGNSPPVSPSKEIQEDQELYNQHQEVEEVELLLQEQIFRTRTSSWWTRRSRFSKFNFRKFSNLCRLEVEEQHIIH
jgi:hypothetical protein